MRVRYYDSHPNFGDQLNKQLWSPYFQRWLTRRDDITFLGVGTLLGERDYGPGRVLVCGAGFGYRAETAALRSERVHVSFVRGPLSARVLGLDASYAVTDPALLVPKQFPQAAASGRVLFVPHWETAANPWWRAACARAEVDYADPRAEVADVLRQVSGARLVLAESLHAAICADAYRVPWLPVVTSPRVNLFKWYDWLRSVALEPRFESLPRLGCSDLARNLEPLHGVLSRVGPRLDTLALKLSPGVCDRLLEEAAKALQRLAAHAGYLSSDSTQSSLLAALEEHIAAAQQWLESPALLSAC